MTEQEWLDSRNLLATMEPLLADENRRRWRLFALACVRRILPLIPAEFHHGIEVAEAFVDRRVDKHELIKAWLPYRSSFGNAQRAACWAACPSGDIITRAQKIIPFQALDAADREGDLEARLALEADYCAYLRDVFGNPYRTMAAADPGWLNWNGGTVRSFARGVYEDRAFEQLPILADALEDAGCEVASILDHCRSPGPHVRGCWVVDLLLEKRVFQET